MIKKGKLYYPSPEVKKQALVVDKKIYSLAAWNPLKFWEGFAKELFWFKKWTKSFSHRPPYFKWFVNGKINITANIFENNPLGFSRVKNKAALIWEPESLEEKPRIITYYELFKEVNRFANALKRLGVNKGDRVGIYLPMIPEVVIAMLACARIGAVHSVVFSAFSPVALQVRLQDTQAKVLITADGYYRRGKIIDLKKNADQGIVQTEVKKVVVVDRAKNQITMEAGRDFFWDDLVKNESDYCEARKMDAEDPLFILYTSGSTGRPKGTVQVCGGYTVQAYATAKLIFDLKEDDIFWSTADVGWITGHTYSCYGPLLNGATFAIFEGSPDWPNPDRWAQVIEKYGVTIFYTAPTAIRMFIKTLGNLNQYKFKTLRIIGSVGEPIDESSWRWYFQEVGKGRCPLVDTWWQTETGGILMTSLPGVGPFRPTYTGLPFPGLKIDILDDQGKSLPAGQEGNLVILPPFVPGLLRGVYNNPAKYLKTYWSDFGKSIYATSDTALRDEQGLVRIVGRSDDVIKVAGHRLTTGELENTINKLTDITESAVVGIPDDIKGQVPVAFIISKSEKSLADLKAEVAAYVRKEIGPIASLKEIYLVNDLPKTRSGKIMRRILRKLFTGEDLGDLSTLANQESVDE
ncbi:MAG: acetate--CoA ligase, partial [bacterium]